MLWIFHQKIKINLNFLRVFQPLNPMLSYTILGCAEPTHIFWTIWNKTIELSLLLLEVLLNQLFPPSPRGLLCQKDSLIESDTLAKKLIIRGEVSKISSYYILQLHIMCCWFIHSGNWRLDDVKFLFFEEN